MNIVLMILDIHRMLCIYRALKRFFQYKNRSRPDMVVGNDEKINIDFYKQIWNYLKDKRPGILNKLKEIGKRKISSF